MCIQISNINVSEFAKNRTCVRESVFENAFGYRESNGKRNSGNGIKLNYIFYEK